MSGPLASASASICGVKRTCVALGIFTIGTFVGSMSGGVLMPMRDTRRRRSGSGTAATAASSAPSSTTSKPPQCKSSVLTCGRSSRRSGPLAAAGTNAVAYGTICEDTASPMALLSPASAWPGALATGLAGALAAARPPTLALALALAVLLALAWASSFRLASCCSCASARKTWSTARSPSRSRQLGSAAPSIRDTQTARSQRRAAAKSTVWPCRSHAFMSAPVAASLAIRATSPFSDASCNSRER
mmetsp:Transcript_81917/g.265496  ORF Transcript_81917/g.265496 Transcript_81917/m.265496 type:complete len:246 (-) Transcript_81917:976-1713(-)